MLTRVIPLRGEPQEIEPWTGTGGHGGGDNVMLTEIFGTAGRTSTSARPTNAAARIRA